MSEKLSSTTTSKVNANSVLDKLKTITTNSMPNINDKTEDLLQGINSKTITNSDTMESSKNGYGKIFNIIRFILIILVVGFILLNILAGLKLLSPYFIKIFKPILLFLEYSIEVPEVIPEKPKIATAIDDEEKNIEKNTMIKDIKKKIQPTKKSIVPKPDKTGSRTQITQNNTKSGYCYIGEDRGFRSCIKVGPNDKCISNDIYPTKAICINPKLRQ